MKNEGEFRGATIQHLKNLDDNICEVKRDVKSLNKRYWIMLILLVIAVVERLPSLSSMVFAK